MTGSWHYEIVNARFCCDFLFVYGSGCDRASQGTKSDFSRNLLVIAEIVRFYWLLSHVQRSLVS